MILKDDFGYEKATGKLKFLPGFAIDFVSDGDAIIPVQRGPQKGSHPDWEWIFEPGQIWSEAGDDGWNRASLPIALQERNANCIHNGLMSFAFKYGEISDVVVQIGLKLAPICNLICGANWRLAMNRKFRPTPKR